MDSSEAINRNLLLYERSLIFIRKYINIETKREVLKEREGGGHLLSRPRGDWNIKEEEGKKMRDIGRI